MKLFRAICSMILVLLIVACGEPAIAPQPEATAVPQEANAPIEESDVVTLATPEPTEIPTLPPTEEPTPTPTPSPEPTPTPEPTRAPREGDIAVNFPDYDTGVDADYSYQSDDLRIAITVHHGQIPDQNGRQLNETWYVADIWIRNINSFRTVFAKDEFNKGAEDGQALATRVNAVLAINGNMNLGVVIHNGTIYQRRGANKGWNSGAVGMIYNDGSLRTFYLQNENVDLDKEIKNGALHGWQFGPIVIRDGEAGPGATRYHQMGYKARNILGYYEPGHYVVFSCDNRGNEAQGMNEYMMVDMMKSLGVKEAFNLDGGTSAVMVFMGEVINQPTYVYDNGKKQEGRNIMDMLVFGEYDETSGAFTDLSTLTASKSLGKN